MLALKRPRNLTNGALIDPEIALSNYNSKQFHHIYPKAHLKRVESSGEHNSLANFCMLAASENNAISDDHPNKYLPRLISELGLEAEDIFASNYLPSPSSIDYSTLEYPEFIDLRAELMLKDIDKLKDGLTY